MANIKHRLCERMIVDRATVRTLIISMLRLSRDHKISGSQNWDSRNFIFCVTTAGSEGTQNR